MAHQDLELRTAIELAAWAVAMAGGALLGLALAAELLRRARTGAGLVALADRLLPTTARRVAAALLTAMAATIAVAVPHAARGDDHVRSWLVERRARSVSRVPDGDVVAPHHDVDQRSAGTRQLDDDDARSLHPSWRHVLARCSAHRLRHPHHTRPPCPPRRRPLRRSRTQRSRRTRCVRVTVSGPSPRHDSAAAPTTHAIDRGWRAIYDANRDSVGSDPEPDPSRSGAHASPARPHPMTREEASVPTLSISAWSDPIIDTLGHDPRSDYVERFWLPTLGPTSAPPAPTDSRATSTANPAGARSMSPTCRRRLGLGRARRERRRRCSAASTA